MSETLLHILLVAISSIFSAGIAWASFKQLRKDVNAIGKKINDSERDALRRHHNVSLVLMLAAPAKKEHEICELLKEG